MPPDAVEEVVAGALRDLADDTWSVAASRAAFDALSCMRAGATVTADAGPPAGSGDVTVVGAGRRAPLLDAIGCNAVACHVLDRDDLHWPSVVHPGGIVWPVAFGVGEALDADVGTVLAAGALGYQVAARMSLYLGAGHRNHFHATTTCGTVAAATVAARLRRGEPSAAARTACSVLGGTRQALAELSDTAFAHRAHATVAGVLADRFCGDHPVAEPLEGPLGFAAATAPPNGVHHADLPPVVGDVTVRTHPVGGFAHTMVDALMSLPARSPDSVESVRVVLPATLAGADRSAPPVDARSAGWVFPVVAALAVTGRIGVRELPWPIDDDVAALAGRVEISVREPEGPGDLRADVEVTVSDGATLMSTCDVPRGHPGDPMPDAELVARGVAIGAFASVEDGEEVLEGLRRPVLSVRELLASSANPAPSG